MLHRCRIPAVQRYRAHVAIAPRQPGGPPIPGGRIVMRTEVSRGGLGSQPCSITNASARRINKDGGDFCMRRAFTVQISSCLALGTYRVD
jgi:hypothetical protein